MPADVDYVEALNGIADRNQRQLSEALITLENRITDLMATAPLKDGSLFDLEWAVKARADIRKLVEDEYLATVDDIVRQYGGVALDTQKMLETYGSFTKLDPEIIRQLQTLEFQGFQEVGTEYLDVVSKEVYQNTLTGTSFAASVANVKAVQGGRLASNAKQLVHDSLMQFDASVNTAIGKQSGATKWKYVGRIIETTRPFCRKHEGKTFTTEEIQEIWEGSWAGKASGDPFIVRGGYNCGHQFRPVFDEESEEVALEDKKTDDKGKVDVFSDDATFSSTDKKTTKAQINSAMGSVTPNQVALINRLPKPKAVVGKANGGLYDSRTNTLTSGMQRGGATVRHEYGHHVDYMLGEKSGRFGAPALSTFDVGFNDAFKADRKGLNLQSKKLREDSMESLRDELYDNKITSFKLPNGNTKFVNNYVIKTDELAAVADIVDAMSDGLFTKRFGGWGHGVTYYKRRGAKQKETFANLFALRNTPEWDFVQKNFPLLAKRFDEIIDGKI